jgi:hypothetical protein
MELLVKRETFTNDSTIGKLYINGAFHCFTLEDRVREVKIPKVTAIPKGKYEVIINFSNRFQQMMPLLLNVPNFQGVRIHSGNYSTDTDGCLLVGSTKGVNMIGNSKAQYAKLMVALRKATKGEKIWLTIE